MSDLVQHIRHACLIEASAPKPGNVHPLASFDDMCFDDMVLSAEAVCEVLGHPRNARLGQRVLEAVEATSRVTTSNTNLGIILLLAPLSMVPTDISLASGLELLLETLDADDAHDVFRAIRLASPGGLGEVTENDVATDPEMGLLESMRQAAPRDDVAACYADGFQRVLDWAHSDVLDASTFDDEWSRQVVRLALVIQAERPDSLIARKCGRDVAITASLMAGDVLAAGWPDTPRSRERFRQLDSWLRADGHRRNPGTTADLVTAVLFVALRDEILKAPPLDPASGQFHSRTV